MAIAIHIHPCFHQVQSGERQLSHRTEKVYQTNTICSHRLKYVRVLQTSTLTRRLRTPANNCWNAVCTCMLIHCWDQMHAHSQAKVHTIMSIGSIHCIYCITGERCLWPPGHDRSLRIIEVGILPWEIHSVHTPLHGILELGIYQYIILLWYILCEVRLVVARRM